VKKIGLISDTHGFINEKLIRFLADVDEIWHAGDIGSMEVADTLALFKPLRAVRGNIDGADVRSVYPKNQRFMCEDTDVWITHIGGYPGNYAREVIKELKSNPPGIFISGHSHILKIIYDRKLNLLHLNPGAAGTKGFHKVCTALRFLIDGKEIKEMEIWELQKNISLL
jgi:uncharacterized protein